ncbi:porin [Tardiphaga sp.]|uniref:OprO/OprP family phosphate-selective porin n=1 Tax=Tardiphaga sp. TaxID=1926292 RepID=UPI00261B7B1D|nr:porin [Tardiphaga sp.]MDB5619265.1 porin [Tardiphaga sp.]
MSMTKWGTAAAVGLIGAITALPAQAQSAGSDSEIALLKAQLKLMEQKLDRLQKQTQANTTAAASANAKAASASAKADVKVNVANANAAYPTKGPLLPVSGAYVKMPGNRPTICTDDNLNCIAITSRLHIDAGGYDYRPNTGATSPQTAQNGVLARRARIGVLGTFAGDWDYALIYDFGGTPDAASFIENAYVTYKGIKNLYIDGGYLDVPYTLDEATSSNNITFIERASAQTIATNIASGDNRAAFGFHANGDWWWVGSYFTGPSSTVSHSLRPQTGATARGVVVPVNNEVGSFIIGADAQFLFDTGGAVGTNNLASFSDRIESRIDPATNALLNANTFLTNVKGVQVFSGEAAGQIGSFYAQGEYFDYRIDRMNGLPDAHFNGGYAQASYVLTGEKRKYNPVTGSYGGVNPANPAHWQSGNYGAWEIAARYSQMNLNDLLVRGGELKNTTVGLNWYVNSNVRFMFDWVHGQVDKATAANLDIGAHYDVYSMRTQVAF